MSFACVWHGLADGSDSCIVNDDDAMFIGTSLWFQGWLSHAVSDAIASTTNKHYIYNKKRQTPRWFCLFLSTPSSLLHCPLWNTSPWERSSPRKLDLVANDLAINARPLCPTHLYRHYDPFIASYFHDHSSSFSIQLPLLGSPTHWMHWRLLQAISTANDHALTADKINTQGCRSLSTQVNISFASWECLDARSARHIWCSCPPMDQDGSDTQGVSSLLSLFAQYAKGWCSCHSFHWKRRTCIWRVDRDDGEYLCRARIWLFHSSATPQVGLAAWNCRVWVVLVTSSL